MPIITYFKLHKYSMIIYTDFTLPCLKFVILNTSSFKKRTNQNKKNYILNAKKRKKINSLTGR